MYELCTVRVWDAFPCIVSREIDCRPHLGAARALEHLSQLLRAHPHPCAKVRYPLMSSSGVIKWGILKYGLPFGAQDVVYTLFCYSMAL